MKQNPDGKTVRAMDVLVPGVGEIIGGSQREDNYENLKARIVELGQNPEDYWWYLDLRKYGSVPHSGFGLGFERAMMYITGMTNVRDVIAFPRTPKNCDFQNFIDRKSKALERGHFVLEATNPKLAYSLDFAIKVLLASFPGILTGLGFQVAGIIKDAFFVSATHASF